MILYFLLWREPWIQGAFERFFGDLEDPRQSAKVAHLFSDILFLLVCASIAGAKGWEEIEDFGDLHFKWFTDKGLFKNGLPVHDTIARVVSRVDTEQPLKSEIKR